VNTKLESEINSAEEMNIYDYWKVLVKRKKIFIGIFLIPLVIATIASFSVPRYYVGEAEISYPVSPVPNISSVITAQNIVRFVGNIDDIPKGKIFTNNPGTIKRVLLSLSKNSTDKVSIVIDAKAADAIPQAFEDISRYIRNLPEIKEEIARIKEEENSKLKNLIEESNFKLKNLIEAKKANLAFLKYLTDVIKKEPEAFVSANPSDYIMKDSNLSIDISNLQQILKKSKMAVVKSDVLIANGTLSPLVITVKPSNSQIRKIIISTGALSLIAAIFVVFLLDYIERIKVYENKQRKLP